MTISQANAADYYVATWGDDLNSGSSVEEPLKSFDKSLSMMNSGDTLFLIDGVWENEYFDFHAHDLEGTAGHPVTIKAYNGSPTITNGSDGKSIIDTSTKDWIVIDGITVTNSYRGYLGGNNNNLSILNCTFSNMSVDGIKFWRQVSDTLIDNVTVSNCYDHGIHYYNQIDPTIVSNHVIRNSDISNCAHNMLDIHTSIHNVLIENNNFYFTRDYEGIKQVGLYLHNGNTDYIRIINNNFYDQPRPLEIINSENLIIENNTFQNIEGIGRAMMLTSDQSSYDTFGRIHNISISNNQINNSYYGIYFWGESSLYSEVYFLNNSLTNIRNKNYYLYDGIFVDSIIFSESLKSDSQITFRMNTPTNNSVYYRDRSNSIIMTAQNISTICDLNYSYIPIDYSGEYLSLTTYPLSATPLEESINVSVQTYSSDWNNFNLNYSVESPSINTVEFIISELEPNQVYNISIDNSFLKEREANSNGILEFSNTNWDEQASIVIISKSNGNISSTNDSVNSAPSINVPSTISGSISNLFLLLLNGTDPNNDLLTYSATDLPTGATLNSTTGEFTWTPTQGQTGLYNVTFTVSDSELTDSQSVYIAVNEPNYAPVIDSLYPAASSTFNETDTINIAASASDLNDDDLSYTIKIDGSTKSISSTYSWVTGHSDQGIHTIEVIVSDGVAETTLRRNVNIQNVNPCWDVNNDNVVNILDITLVGQDFGSENPQDACDMNNDGKVNIQDLTIIAHYFGDTIE